MCGIAGIMTRDGRPPDSRVLDRLIENLGHRGPDGDGKHLSYGVGMVQTRLAIIDLETGDQPLYEPGGAALVANGEIYNYRELRDELDDVRFATRSDCEPPLHLYRREGPRFSHRLRGMYAIAIHDPAESRLVLTRDPFGIKPLYYVETPTVFAFASEPQALIAAGLATPELHPGHRDELLQTQFTCGAETIYQGIQRVLPGETLVVRSARVVDRHRRDALAAGPPAFLSEDSALQELDRVLEDSVAMHQRSDVPYGLFFSGGIDSTAVLAMMARLNDKPVNAFTASFPETADPDQKALVRSLAEQCNATLTEVEFGEQDFWTLLPQVVADIDDPAADYAVLPTWKLAQTAAQDLKVVLSGEGGDELFAGYGRYRSVLRPWWMGGRTIRSKGAFDGLGVLRETGTAWRDGIASAEARVAEFGWTPLQRAQAIDCADWLPNDLLTKLDRCLMAHGLEGRTPFLDPVVAGFAFGLPDALKVKKHRGKWLLRRWLDKTVPGANAFERKRGFTVPVSEWIRRHGTRLGELVAAQPAVEAACRPDRVRRLYLGTGKREGFAAWTLLFYALWHKHHVEGAGGDGDVFEVLADRG